MSETAAPSVAPPGTQNPPKPGLSPRKRAVYIVLAAVLVTGGAAVGIWYYLYAAAHEWTDDAFIAADVTAVSSRVPGRVVKVNFRENQKVAKGDVLVEIDPRDFEIRLAQARAGLSAAQHQEKTARTNVGLVKSVTAATIYQAQGGVGQADAGLAMAKAGIDAARAKLAQADAGIAASEAERQAAAEGLKVAEAQVGQTQAKIVEQKGRLAEAQSAPDRIAVAESQLLTAEAEVKRLQALVDQAELELSYAKVLAPESGRLARKVVEPGAMFQAGQAMVSLVSENVWVVANFKETALDHIRPGQSATITVDAYPGVVFHGHVDSIQSGTGAQFSLLPPENATGNYVKIVQRVPVKILLDDPPDPEHLLAPGMSVIPEVELKTPGAEARK